jgi:single-stranded-DNA-specific exonuclease
VQNGSSPIDAIGFGLGDKLSMVKKGSPLKIAYALEENVWQGESRLQLRIKDIQ